jgi:hypothetical protein
MIESMNGGRFVHDRLQVLGWEGVVADAHRVWRRWPARPTGSTPRSWRCSAAQPSAGDLAARPVDPPRARAGALSLASGPPSHDAEEPARRAPRRAGEPRPADGARARPHRLRRAAAVALRRGRAAARTPTTTRSRTCPARTRPARSASWSSTKGALHEQRADHRDDAAAVDAVTASLFRTGPAVDRSGMLAPAPRRGRLSPASPRRTPCSARSWPATSACRRRPSWRGANFALLQLPEAAASPCRVGRRAGASAPSPAPPGDRLRWSWLLGPGSGPA